MTFFSSFLGAMKKRLQVQEKRTWSDHFAMPTDAVDGPVFATTVTSLASATDPTVTATQHVSPGGCAAPPSPCMCISACIMCIHALFGFICYI
jgi:hypothetical protein